MQNFISTETIILLSFLCKQMPNLLKYIVLGSTTADQDANTLKLTAHQIIKAKSHPNTIALQTFTTAFEIQKGMDTIRYKIDELLKQRESIQSALIALMPKEY